MEMTNSNSILEPPDDIDMTFTMWTTWTKSFRSQVSCRVGTSNFECK